MKLLADRNDRIRALAAAGHTVREIAESEWPGAVTRRRVRSVYNYLTHTGTEFVRERTLREAAAASARVPAAWGTPDANGLALCLACHGKGRTPTRVTCDPCEGEGVARQPVTRQRVRAVDFL